MVFMLKRRLNSAEVLFSISELRIEHLNKFQSIRTMDMGSLCRLDMWQQIENKGVADCFCLGGWHPTIL